MYKGKKILITSGPTRMPLDAMRFLSNRSTGRFGTLLATEALKQGAQVTFVYGVGSEIPKVTGKGGRHLRCIPVETNAQVSDTLRKLLKSGRYDVVIHAMAVLDFQPVVVRKGKTKTKKGNWNLRLVPTPKIINQIKKWDPKIFLVGFKLEVGASQNTLLKSAHNLIRQTKADLVLANQLTEGEDKSHIGFLLDSKGNLLHKTKGKKNLAKLILDVATQANRY